MTQRWQPLPSSLEYDLITDAIHGKEIPVEYRICQLVDVAEPSVPVPVPVEVARVIKNALRIIRMAAELSDQFNGNNEMVTETDTALAWLSQQTGGDDANA